MALALTIPSRIFGITAIALNNSRLPVIKAKAGSSLDEQIKNQAALLGQPDFFFYNMISRQ